MLKSFQDFSTGVSPIKANSIQSMYIRRGSCPERILRSQLANSESEDDESSFSAQQIPPLAAKPELGRKTLSHVLDSKELGFFTGVGFAFVCNALISLVAIKNISGCISSIIDALLVPLLMTSYFGLMCVRNKLHSTQKCILYLCAMCTVETLSNDMFKAPLILSVSILTFYMTSLLPDHTNLAMSAALCVVRTYAMREFRLISSILRPYAVYLSAFFGLLSCNYVSFLGDGPPDQLTHRASPQKRRIRITFLNNAQRKRYMYHQSSLVERRELQVHRPGAPYSAFSLSATPVGTAIDIPNVKSKRILEMKLRNATSFDNLAFTSGYASGQRCVRFNKPERTSDYETDSAAASVTLDNNVATHAKLPKQPCGMPFTEDELNNALPLPSLLSWHFNIFEFAQLAQDKLMSMLAYRIFDQVGLLEAFNIPLEQFFNFMRLVQSTYHDNPYHNRIHAADVFHTCFVLTTADVRFPSQEKSPTDSESELFHFKHNRQCIGARLAPLEVLAIYIAAIIHDVDHPGRTNNFLIKKRDRLAILYNDRSVLENHHVAEAWRCILSSPRFDFLCNLEAEEWERLRFLVVELVLATDLVKHHQIIDEFRKRSRGVQSYPKVNWKDPEERLLLCKMIIKIADVATPCKPLPLYLIWARRVQDEFYLQGDDEKSSNLPISEFMDRNNPDEIKLQNNFTRNITLPIIECFDEAGLFPYERGNKGKCEILQLLHSNQEFLLKQRQRGRNVIPANCEDGVELF